MRMRRVVLAGVVALAAVAGGRSTLRGDPLPASSLNWIFDGPVRGTARLGDTLYVGGDFTRVAPSSAAIGSAYAVTTSTGALVPGVFPRVDGAVLAIEPDGAGGYYLGGDFQIPGAPQPTRLARVRPDGTFDPAFAPVIARTIVSLVRVGGVLYFVQAASFGVGPQPGVGAVDATTGAGVPWQPSLPAGFRATVLAASPHGVVIGGQELIAPISMSAIGTFDPTSGASLWYRVAAGGVGMQSNVSTLLVAGPRVLVAYSQGLASLDAATGVIDAGWNPQVTGVSRLAASGGTLYLAGSFSSIGGQVRPGLAAVDLATAALLPWNPQLVFGRGVSQIVPMPGGTVFADGVAATGAARRRLVEIDAGGAVTPWAPEAFAESITALRLGVNGALLVGSPLAAHGGTARTGLAAFDIPSGALLPWAPDAGPAYALVAADGVVYAGLFGVTAFDALTGAAVPGPGLGILGGFLAAHDGWLYGSHFSSPRGPLLMWRYDLQSRTLDPSWRLSGSATALAGAGSRLILATAGGLSAIDADTAAPLWTNAAGPASAVAISGDTVYSNLGGTNLTTHDLRTGELLTSTAIGFQPSALAIADGRLVINGSPHAETPLAVRTLNGQPLAPTWEPRLVRTLTDTRGGSLLVGDDLLVASGTFGRSAAPALQGLAAFPLDGARAPAALRMRFNGPATVLEWDAPDIAPAGYVLHAGRTPGATEFALPLGAVTSYSVIPPTGTFYVRVVALAPGGVESSNEVLVRGGCAAAPPPPSGVLSTITGSQVSFTWTAPDAPVTRYDLEVGTARGLADLLTVAVPGTATAFSAAAPPGSYAVRARAVNACGASAPSGSVVVVVGASDALPAAPTGLTPTVFTFQARVDFTWTAPAGPVTGYVLEAGRAPGDASVGSFVLGPVTSLSVTAVPAGAYVVRLRAVNGAGTGPPGAEVGVRVP